MASQTKAAKRMRARRQAERGKRAERTAPKVNAVRIELAAPYNKRLEPRLAMAAPAF